MVQVMSDGDRDDDQNPAAIAAISLGPPGNSLRETIVPVEVQPATTLATRTRTPSFASPSLAGPLAVSSLSVRVIVGPSASEPCVNAKAGAAPPPPRGRTSTRTTAHTQTRPAAATGIRGSLRRCATGLAALGGGMVACSRTSSDHNCSSNLDMISVLLSELGSSPK